ncbi:MAG: hypothetical protein AB9888_15455 [Bacteroidales bacterium]
MINTVQHNNIDQFLADLLKTLSFEPYLHIARFNVQIGPNSIAGVVSIEAGKFYHQTFTIGLSLENIKGAHIYYYFLPPEEINYAELDVLLIKMGLDADYQYVESSQTRVYRVLQWFAMWDSDEYPFLILNIKNKRKQIRLNETLPTQNLNTEDWINLATAFNVKYEIAGNQNSACVCPAHLASIASMVGFKNIEIGHKREVPQCDMCKESNQWKKLERSMIAARILFMLQPSKQSKPFERRSDIQ